MSCQQRKRSKKKNDDGNNDNYQNQGAKLKALVAGASEISYSPSFHVMPSGV
jgi:hypothetical protein